MTELLEKISTCVEFGKVDIKSPYPPAMKDQEGAFELTRHALDDGISPGEYPRGGTHTCHVKSGAEVFKKRNIRSADANGREGDEQLDEPYKTLLPFRRNKEKRYFYNRDRKRETSTI